jgi:acylphosphatase
MTAARFFVEGHVQGVFFRASTRQQATDLGVRGYARNLHDGRVEVLAVGDVQAVERLAEWLKHGPPHARVDRVERIEADEGEAGPEFDTA